jgi:uncharacterized LabA/DUF88 family protein
LLFQNNFKGYRSAHDGKEKLVDVRLAVDIVNKAHQHEYDELYLMSGDVDVMYALEKAKEVRKKVRILAIQNRIPHRFVYLYKTYIAILNAKKWNIKPYLKRNIVTFWSLSKDNIYKII